MIIQHRKNNGSLRAKVQAGLLLIIKEAGSLRVGLFSCNTLHCLCRHHLVLHILPCRKQGLGYQSKSHTLITAITVSNKLSFVSDPGFSCLLSAFVKPVSLQVGKTLEPSTFLIDTRYNILTSVISIY